MIIFPNDTNASPRSLWLASSLKIFRSLRIKVNYAFFLSQSLEHLLQCPLLKTSCSRDDLSIFNDTAQKCVKLWQSTI